MEEYPAPPEPEPPKERVPTPWEIEEKSKAADYIRQEKADAEQRERDSRRLQEGWTSAQHQYLTGEIKSEKALYDELSRLFKNYGDESNKDHWRYQEDLAAMKRKFDQEAADAEDRRLEDSKAKQAEAAKIAEDGLLAEQEDVKDHLETIVKDYNNSFDELEKQRETYKKRLMAEAGDLFSVTTEIRDDGVEVTTFAIENIDEQIKKMRDYHDDMKMLKFDGASLSLLNEINSLGPGDGTRFANEIANMSDAEREQLYLLYETRDAIADELSADLFKDEANMIQSVFNEKYNIISDEAYAAGVNAGNEFADGFHNGLNEIMGGLQSEVFADLYNISASLAPVPMFVHSQPSGGGDGTGDAGRPIVIESHIKTDFNLDGRKLGEATYHYVKETERISGG
jgi:tetrahydromethanopterin S-methyltransferase subunit B